MTTYSRGGCAACRNSHVKCDEKRPGCTRCVNRGILCPGYRRPLRWSQKFESVATPPAAVAVPPGEDSSLQEVVIDRPDEALASREYASTESEILHRYASARANGPAKRSTAAACSSTDFVAVAPYPLSPSAFQDYTLFVEYYSAVLARVLSIYDGIFSPFQAQALSQWRHSSLLFSAFKFFAGIYQLGIEPNAQNRLAVDEARLGVLGGLSASIAVGTSSVVARKTEILLVINMFGLSSSWYDLSDLGLEHYNAATSLLADGPGITPKSQWFFEEFLIYWWMMLSFSDTPYIPGPPTLTHGIPLGPRIPHPLTGASPDSQLLLGMVGRLVLAQRRGVLELSMTTAEALLFSLSNIERAYDLKHRLLALEFPSAEMVLDPGDPHTSVQDLLNIAQGYRNCALILLCHCYPDLSDNKPTASSVTQEQRQEHRTSLAFQVLRLLESNSKTSGTCTIEAILLVIVSGELTQFGGPQVSAPYTTVGDTVSEQSPNLESHQEIGSNVAISHARSVVLARFARIQAILPFRTILRMKSLVLEVWRLMDSGSHVFWVDLLIKNNWHFLMI